MKKEIWKRVLRCVPVLVVTVIAGYGLAIAPSKASDHLAEELQQEFAENQELLKMQEQIRAESSENKDELTDTEPTSKEASDAKAKETLAEVQPEETEEKELEGITFVGDSVMLGAAPSLMEKIPEAVIDAKECRQAVEGIEIVKALEQEGKLGDTVIIELGINSYFASSTGQELIDYLGKDRKIYWLTVYGKYLQDQERTNGVITDLANANENVEVIPWDKEAEDHDEWFYNDGIHLNGEGREGFANLMQEAIGYQTESN